jgi:hypothetical protein
MTITIPTGVVVVDQADLIQPSADADPLQTILENAAHLYAYGPAHLTAVYTCADKITGRSVVFQVPIVPSADGIDYTFKHHVRTGTGTSNLTVKVEEWTGAAWNTIENSTAIAAGANTVVTHSHTDTVDANATILRLTYSRATGTDELTPDSVCMYPAVSSIAAGIKTSSFVPFDDGLLSSAGSPVHTEFLNRAVRDAAAVLRDRQQCALAFVQEDSSTYTKHEVSTAGVGAGAYIRLGAARFSAPYQVNPLINVYVIASVSAGSTSDIVRVRQLGPQGEQVLLSASGGVETGTLRLKMPGGPYSVADLEVAATHMPGSEAYIHAVVAYWTPGD